MPTSERALAIDYGERRVGLAVSDPDFQFVRGLPTIDRRELRGSLADAIGAIVDSEAIDTIVLGLPLTLDGEVGSQAREVRAFAEELAIRIDQPIVEWDERLTSEAARRALREAGHDEKAVRQKVDQLSAVLMLESYVRSRVLSEESE